jgi:DNA (cytosine-5)-methyltransferase 1
VSKPFRFKASDFQTLLDIPLEQATEIALIANAILQAHLKKCTTVYSRNGAYAWSKKQLRSDTVYAKLFDVTERGGLLNGLGLFEGIGGLTLALRAHVRPVAFCENDAYAQAVLLKHFPHVPIWDDVRSFPALPVPVDIIYGGFPCQDISCAGRGGGLEGQRSGLFFEALKLIKQFKPTFVFLENVPSIRTRGAERVCKELASIRYDCRWGVVSAQEMGAPHRRERWFLLAYADKFRSNEGQSTQKLQRRKPNTRSQGPNVANAKRERGRGDTLKKQTGREEAHVCGWWKTEPNVGRVVDGLPMRVDRIKCLGNAVVPRQAKEAFERLLGTVKLFDVTEIGEGEK